MEKNKNRNIITTIVILLVLIVAAVIGIMLALSSCERGYPNAILSYMADGKQHDAKKVKGSTQLILNSR